MWEVGWVPWLAGKSESRLQETLVSNLLRVCGAFKMGLLDATEWQEKCSVGIHIPGTVEAGNIAFLGTSVLRRVPTTSRLPCSLSGLSH